MFHVILGGMERERTYVCIDLKSFYASVECVRRGLDPMRTRLVVADPDFYEGTADICLYDIGTVFSCRYDRRFV